MTVVFNLKGPYMFSDFLRKKKKTAIITFLLTFLIIWWLSSDVGNALFFSLTAIIPFLYIGFLIGGREKMLKKNPDLVEKLEKAEKRKTLDDRLGIIGLLILGVISTPFVDGFLYVIFLICGVTGVFRLLGSKGKELSGGKRAVAWVLAIVFVVGTFFFKYLDFVSKGTISSGY